MKSNPNITIRKNSEHPIIKKTLRVVIYCVYAVLSIRPSLAFQMRFMIAISMAAGTINIPVMHSVINFITEYIMCFILLPSNAVRGGYPVIAV